VHALNCPRCGHPYRPQARFCGQCGVPLAVQELPTLAGPSPALAAQPTAAHSTSKQTDELLPVAQSWPTGMIVGSEQRYRIERQIGAGSFGQVYLARDLRLDRPCVVKRLLVRHQTTNLLAMIEREARLLVTLNDPGHPSIPEIYDYLVAECSLVMKYLSGQSLAEYTAARGGRLEEHEALSLIREACAALVYMHTRFAEAVLHRDLKPANLLRDSEGRVWLIDFGLARVTVGPLNPTTISDTDTAGTLGFTPPEQWRGAAEPRSDVYALGATLYVLLAGSIPERSTLLQIARGELSYPPLREVAPGVSVGVERLLIQVLAANVTARPGARELLAALDGIVQGYGLPPAPEPEAVPYSTTFIERATEQHYWQEQLQRHGVALLWGMAGVGKTSLAGTLALQARDRNSIFWHSLRRGAGGDRLLWALAAFLARLGKNEAWRYIHSAWGHNGYWQATEQLLAYLAPLLRGEQLLLVLDDLHLADGDPLVEAIIVRLLAEARDGYVQLIITSRTMPRAFYGVEPLTGLHREEAGILFERLQIQLNPTLQQELYTLTEGNAHLLLLAGTAVRRGSSAQRLSDQLANAPDIERYLLHEVDQGLNREERTTMEAVAVLLGAGGSRHTIEALLGGGNLRRVLTELVSRNLLKQQEGTAGPVYHQHTIVQQFYYGGLNSSQRKTLHGRAAQHYAAETGQPFLAALHWVRAGDHNKAAQLIVANLELLINNGQAQAVDELIQELELTYLTPELSAALCTASGEIAALLGKFSKARADLLQALAYAADLEATSERITAQARRYRLLALISERGGDYQQAEEECREGLALTLGAGLEGPEIAQLYAQLALILDRQGKLKEADAVAIAGFAALPAEAEAPRERATLLLRRAAIAGARGKYPQAIEWLQQGLALAQRAGDLMLEARLHNNLGQIQSFVSKRASARQHLERSAQLWNQLGNRGASVAPLLNLAITYQQDGAYQQAYTYLHEAERIADELAMPGDQALIAQSLGIVGIMAGKLVAARIALDKAIELYGGLHDQYGIAETYYRLAELALEEGRPAQARQWGHEAFDMFRLIGNPVYEACCLRLMADAALAEGATAKAERYLVAALAQQVTIEEPYDRALLLAAQARLDLARGRREAARQHIEQGLQLTQAHGLAYPQAKLTALLSELGLHPRDERH
jgi:tetratricopeptide (TPR) repeat protein/predicted Ser/Thr protein kinase